MNETLQEGVQLAKDINDLLKADKPNCDVVICTPFIHLASVAPVLDKEIVGLGAENCADKEKGAYTGEVSAAIRRRKWFGTSMSARHILGLEVKK